MDNLKTWWVGLGGPLHGQRVLCIRKAGNEMSRVVAPGVRISRGAGRIRRKMRVAFDGDSFIGFCNRTPVRCDFDYLRVSLMALGVGGRWWSWGEVGSD